MPTKKTSTKPKTTRTKTPKKDVTSPLLALFPHPPPSVPTGAPLPERGEPGSWDDELDRLPAEPETASIAGTHWMPAKRTSFWRFEPDGKMTYGASGGTSAMAWRQKGPWVLVANAPHRTVEILARVEGGTLVGHYRGPFVTNTVELQRAEAAPIDDFIRASHELTAWLVGPRDRPQPPAVTWPPRTSMPARGGAAMRPLSFANHRAATPLAAMTSAAKKHLAAYTATIDQQAEFGGIEAIDLRDGNAVAYVLYWWPFTDGALVEAASGDVVADLLDGSLVIEDAVLRSCVETAYRAARDAGTLPISLGFR